MTTYTCFYKAKKVYARTNLQLKILTEPRTMNATESGNHCSTFHSTTKTSGSQNLNMKKDYSTVRFNQPQTSTSKSSKNNNSPASSSGLRNIEIHILLTNLNSSKEWLDQ